MLLTEYDRELHMKIIKKEAYEDGFKEGYEQGYKEGYEEGYEEGYKIGLALGPEGNQSRFILLLNRLLDLGRTDDFFKVSDPAFREKMGSSRKLEGFWQMVYHHLARLRREKSDSEDDPFPYHAAELRLARGSSLNFP